MRNTNIDLFRVVASFAVIIAHTHPFKDFTIDEHTLIEALINQSCRFCVPFFFIISGYCWSSKLSQKSYAFSNLLPRIKQLCYIYLIWCGLYLFIATDLQQLMQYGYLKITYWRFYDACKDPINTIFSGTRTHLWYIPALVLCQILIFGMFKYQRALILPISFALFIAGIMGGAYQDTAIGMHLPFDTRNGIFFGSVFIVIGILLKQHKVQVSTLTALALIACGLIGQLLEVGYLWRYFDIDPTEVDYVFSTLPFGLGVTLLALSLKSQPLQFLSRIGQYNLGIYLVHIIFVDLLRPLGFILSPWAYALLVPITVFLGSMLFVKKLNELKSVRFVFG